MKKYNINLSPKAYDDLKKINEYIINELLEPEIAHNLFRLIIDEIYKLDNFPSRNSEVILTGSIHKGLRKMMVKNYLILYDIEERQKLVTVRRILYGASDWGKHL